MSPFLLVNDLAPAAMRLRPELARTSARLADATGQPVHLTGSGSGLFILLDDRRGALAALESVPPDLRPHCRLVQANPW